MHRLELVTSRYLLFARDGALGTTGENFVDMITSAKAGDAQLVRDNADRVFVKIKPRRVRAWDFSKAPIGWQF